MYTRGGSNTYATLELETSVMNASPQQLITLLFDGALSALRLAKLHIEQGNIAAKGAAISKAINIIDSGLKGGLNLEQGGELAQNLEMLYDYLIQRLLYANLHSDTDVLLQVNELLSGVADAWKQISSQPSSQTVQE